MPSGSPSSGVTRSAATAPASGSRQDEARAAAGEEQLSLFAVISAVATDPEDAGGEEHVDDDDDADDHDGSDFELTLAPPPPLAGGEAAGEGAPTRREQKQLLREANAGAARELVRRTASTHAQVNAELNRLSGVRRVSEATIEQLERRLAAADRWLVRS